MFTTRFPKTHTPLLTTALVALGLVLAAPQAFADRERRVQRANGAEINRSVERGAGQFQGRVEKSRANGNTVTKERYRGDGEFGRSVTRTNPEGQSVTYGSSGTRTVDPEAGTASSSRVFTGPGGQTRSSSTTVSRSPSEQ